MEEKFLATFYAHVLMWVKDGCPRDNQYNFRIDEGLCGQLISYVIAIDQRRHIKELNRYMSNTFHWAGLARDFPFNHSFNSFQSFMGEVTHSMLYTNPERMQWLERHADPELMKGYKPELRKEHGSFYL